MTLASTILVLLVIVPLAVLAVRGVVLLAQLLGGRRRGDSSSAAPGRVRRQEYLAPVEAQAAPVEAQAAPVERAPATVASESSRLCGVCGQPVLTTAVICRHCGAVLSH